MCLCQHVSLCLHLGVRPYVCLCLQYSPVTMSVFLTIFVSVTMSLSLCLSSCLSHYIFLYHHVSVSMSVSVPVAVSIPMSGPVTMSVFDTVGFFYYLHIFLAGFSSSVPSVFLSLSVCGIVSICLYAMLSLSVLTLSVE
jgi:hypothetical protein